ncbi:MAG: outer membrane protein assembly factor BamE domain-containing protein [Thermoanaerobaculia bacterium]
MNGQPSRSGKLVVLGILAVAAAGIAIFATRPQTQVALSSNPDVNRSSAHVLPGRTSEQREKVDPGLTAAQVESILGKPSEKSESRGDVVSGRWNYLYSDGNLVVNLRDGRVTEIETTFY